MEVNNLKSLLVVNGIKYVYVQLQLMHLNKLLLQSEGIGETIERKI